MDMLVSAPAPGTRLATTDDTSPPPAFTQNPRTVPGRPVRPASSAAGIGAPSLSTTVCGVPRPAGCLPRRGGAPPWRTDPRASPPDPHAGLPRVASDHGPDRLVGDVEVLCFGVAEQFDHPHPLAQPRRHWRPGGRSHYEEHPGEIERQVEIAVAEPLARHRRDHREQRPLCAARLGQWSILSRRKTGFPTPSRRSSSTIRPGRPKGVVQRRCAAQPSAGHSRNAGPNAAATSRASEVFPTPPGRVESVSQWYHAARCLLVGDRLRVARVKVAEGAALVEPPPGMRLRNEKLNACQVTGLGGWSWRRARVGHPHEGRRSRSGSSGSTRTQGRPPTVAGSRSRGAAK